MALVRPNHQIAGTNSVAAVASNAGVPIHRHHHRANPQQQLANSTTSATTTRQDLHSATNNNQFSTNNLITSAQQQIPPHNLQLQDLLARNFPHTDCIAALAAYQSLQQQQQQQQQPNQQHLHLPPNPSRAPQHQPHYCSAAANLSANPNVSAPTTTTTNSSNNHSTPSVPVRAAPPQQATPYSANANSSQVPPLNFNQQYPAVNLPYLNLPAQQQQQQQQQQTQQPQPLAAHLNLSNNSNQQLNSPTEPVLLQANQQQVPVRQHAAPQQPAPTQQPPAPQVSVNHHQQQPQPIPPLANFYPQIPYTMEATHALQSLINNVPLTQILQMFMLTNYSASLAHQVHPSHHQTQHFHHLHNAHHHHHHHHHQNGMNNGGVGSVGHNNGGQDDTMLTMSESKPRGLTRAEIDSLTPYVQMHDDPRICVICLSKFELKSKIRPLPCNHAFHAKCVDKWLRTNRTCPICRRDALKTYRSKIKRI